LRGLVQRRRADQPPCKPSHHEQRGYEEQRRQRRQDGGWKPAGLENFGDQPQRKERPGQAAQIVDAPIPAQASSGLGKPMKQDLAIGHCRGGQGGRGDLRKGGARTASNGARQKTRSVYHRASPAPPPAAASARPDIIRAAMPPVSTSSSRLVYDALKAT